MPWGCVRCVQGVPVEPLVDVAASARVRKRPRDVVWAARSACAADVRGINSAIVCTRALAEHRKLCDQGRVLTYPWAGHREGRVKIVDPSMTIHKALRIRVWRGRAISPLPGVVRGAG